MHKEEGSRGKNFQEPGWQLGKILRPFLFLIVWVGVVVLIYMVNTSIIDNKYPLAFAGIYDLIVLVAGIYFTVRIFKLHKHPHHKS